MCLIYHLQAARCDGCLILYRRVDSFDTIRFRGNFGLSNQYAMRQEISKIEYQTRASHTFK